MYSVSPEESIEVQVTNNVLNATVILDCIASGGPNNTFEWLLDGEVIENETTATLTLNQVIGVEYTCRVSNAAGSGNASITITGLVFLYAYLTKIMYLLITVCKIF